MFTSKSMKAIAAVLCLVILTGCVALHRVEGVWTGLNGELLDLRNSFVVQPERLKHPPKYAPVESCNYRVDVVRDGRSLDPISFPLTIKSVRDRLLVSYEYGSPASTAIIDTRGRIHDFNFVDVFFGDRWDSESLPNKISKLRQSLGPEPGWLNQIQLLFPELNSRALLPGDRLGVLHDVGKGSVWGHYVYRGRSIVAGRSAIMGDVLRSSPALNGQPFNYGFGLFDEDTFVPLLVIFMLAPDSYIKVQRTECP